MKNLKASKLVKGVVATGAVVGVLFGMTACSDSKPSGGESGGGSSLSGTLNVIAYSSVWEEQYRAAVIEPFQKANPGVTVNYVSKRSSAEMLSALQGQKSNPGTDVAIMDQSVAKSANQQGLFAKFSATDVPNLSKVKKEFLDADGYGPAVHVDAYAILYDTKTFSTPPTSWSEFWNPKWAGKVNLTAPPSLLGLAFTAAACTLEGEDYTKSIEKGIAKIKQLAPSVQTFAPNPDEYQNIITGQTVIGVGQNGRGQYYAEQSGNKMGLAFPKEGTMYQINTVNLVEGAPNKAVATAFINYTLSDAAQIAFASKLFYAPSTDAKVPADVAKRIVATDGSQKILPWDLAFVASIRDPWTEVWKKEIIK